MAKVTGQPLVHFWHWKQAVIFCPLAASNFLRSDGLGTIPWALVISYPFRNRFRTRPKAS
jgi:hypothetical protein